MAAGAERSESRTTPGDITAAVLATFAHAADPRLRRLLESLVRDPQAFATETGLIEREWADGIRVLTETRSPTRCGWKGELVLDESLMDRSG